MVSESSSSRFAAHRCDDSCPEILTNESTSGLSCDLVCYRGCDASCLKDYDPLFQFETGIEGVVFGVGNSISLICLSLTLLTFCVFRHLQTVRGMAIMNLCVALFSAKLSFLVNPHFTGVSSHWCSAVAVLQHYSCLSAFHWVSVLAYDLLLTVKYGRRQETTGSSAVKKSMQKDIKSSHPRFLTYMLFAWGFPWCGIFSCAIVEALQEFDFHYGNHEHCGVFGDEALLYSLAIPLTLITTVNVGFFIVIVCHPGLRKPVGIHRAKMHSLDKNRIVQQLKYAVSKKPFVRMNHDQAGYGKQDGENHNKEDHVEELSLLNIYAGKSFLMATAWLSGFVAAFTHVYELWILFIIMNAMQGIFMFKSFVLKPDVKRMWRRKLNGLMQKRRRDIPGSENTERVSEGNLGARDKTTVAVVGEKPVFEKGGLAVQSSLCSSPM